MRPNDQNEIIELNVGGFTYTTSRTTILSYPDSMLSRMISGQIPTATDTNQRIFIDRDGPIFRHILNFLRDKRLNIPENFNEYAQLRQEADFYQIEPIVTYLDCLFPNKFNCKNSMSASTTSLATIANTENASSKGMYFTIISKLHQGTMETLIGCIRIMSAINSLDANSKKFLTTLLNPPSNSTNPVQNKSLENFVCEFKFMHEEKIICCKPCGLSGSATDPGLLNLTQSIFRLAKRFGITTGYWEDMFYLGLECAAPNREQFCSILAEKSNAKLLSSCVCDRRTSYDDTNNCSLVERWFITEFSTNSN
ncbi:unnamed protein product [Brachionus calyciflorus]|uniref:BTB domain-containing protein n=1 Tax=Brachionus calyciflorus TaxID=104777 RepID=A0A814ELA7_9BILA|nr:unnamed protein product [Brachionus calyciflorus]